MDLVAEGGRLTAESQRRRELAVTGKEFGRRLCTAQTTPKFLPVLVNSANSAALRCAPPSIAHGVRNVYLGHKHMPATTQGIPMNVDVVLGVSGGPRATLDGPIYLRQEKSSKTL